MLDSKIKLSKDRSSLVIYVDQNTHSRSCGESRSDWTRAGVIPLARLPKILDLLVKSQDGTEVAL